MTTLNTAMRDEQTLSQTTIDNTLSCQTAPVAAMKKASVGSGGWSLKRLCVSIVAGSVLALGLCALPLIGQPANSHTQFQPVSSHHIVHTYNQKNAGTAYRMTVTPKDSASFSYDGPIFSQPAPAVEIKMAAVAASDYRGAARQAASQAGISQDYFVRQIQAESGFNPNAVSGVGAQGIAQFMPATAASMGINPNDPVAALNGAARWMGSLNGQFGGNYAKALAAYNAGPGAVQSAVRAGGGNWLSLMPAETQNYVHQIMG